MLTIQKKLSPSFFALLSLPATAMGFALSVQIAALSWILSTRYNLAIHDIGLVWAAGPIAGILGQVIIGFISDRVWFWGGRRRPFILIGGILSSVMLLALPNLGIIADKLDGIGILGVALIVALTLDLSINVSFNPTRSVIADVTPEGEKRTQGYTWMQTISGSFGVLAYFIGATLGNFTLIYFGAVLVLLFSVVPTLFIDEPRQLAQSETTDAPLPKFELRKTLMILKPLWGFFLYSVYALSLRLLNIQFDHYWAEIVGLIATLGLVFDTLFSRKKGNTASFQKVLAAHSFTWLGVQTMFIYMFSWLQFKLPGLGDDELGKTISIAFLLMSIVSAVLPVLVLEPLSKKIGLVKTHRVSIASMAVAYALIWLFAESALAVYFCMVLLGIGWASTISLPFAIMSQQVDRQEMGLYMGLFNLSVVLPQLVASLGVGLLVSRALDKGLIFLICAVCLAVSALAWMRVEENS